MRNELVLLPNGWPFTWNVLFVDPVPPGHAPVAGLYQPAPVFGGATSGQPHRHRPSPRRGSFCIADGAIGRVGLDEV